MGQLPKATRTAPVRAVAHAPKPVPAKDRRLNFGSKWDYAPAPEDYKHIPIAPRHELFIGGKFVAPHSGKYFDSINPATEEKLTEIALADEVDVDRAVQSARTAYDGIWSKLPASERGKYLYRIARIIQEKARELAILETLDGGKPIKESRDFDLPMVAAHFFYYAGWADKLKYAFPGKTPRPLGVAGQIIPWNFPLLMAAWKIAPALACGNTVVLKPAETTSLTALHLAEIFAEAGLPDGVVNIITGAGATGSALVNHPDVDKIAFTGSTEVGKAIAKAIAQRSANAHVRSSSAGHADVGVRAPKLTLELGGKAANIIFEDAPLDQAIEGIINAIYFNQGHVCCAGSRLFVQESIYKTVIKKLRDRLATLRVGNPLDKNTDIGAINSHAQLMKIHELVRSGVEEGADLHQSSCALPTKGYWFPPSFLTGVTASHRVAQEEIFGPVLVVIPFKDDEDAIRIANDSEYGLSGGVISADVDRAVRIAKRIRTGTIGVNGGMSMDVDLPFGGYKQSGVGKEWGADGFEEYLEIKSLAIGIPG